jgi:histidyl-tRNA synthetase
MTMQSLPGFRTFYSGDCAGRNYILSKWREVARRYGFVEYDGPVLEPMELYEKKSGGERIGQLFDLRDKGGRIVAMRPEMTTTLARMVAARGKGFQEAHEVVLLSAVLSLRKAAGRLREFSSSMRISLANLHPLPMPSLSPWPLISQLGLTEQDFVVRLRAGKYGQAC